MPGPSRSDGPNDDPVTSSAGGLPPGLPVNPGSGAAASGPDVGMATTTDGTVSDHQTFTWNVGSPASRPALPDQSASEVKPDLLIGPPEQNPDQPHDPPGSPDH